MHVRNVAIFIIILFPSVAFDTAVLIHLIKFIYNITSSCIYIHNIPFCILVGSGS